MKKRLLTIFSLLAIISGAGYIGFRVGASSRSPVQKHTAELIRKCGEKDPVPDSGFSSVDELRIWSGSSAFGGGSFSKLELSEHVIYVTHRLVTSGAASTELILWRKVHGRVIPCLIMPARYGSYTAEVKDNAIIVRHHRRTHSDFVEVMRVKPEYFDYLPWLD